MGLSSHLHDVSGDSIPLLLLAAAAASIAYIRSLLIRLLSLSLSSPAVAAAAAEPSSQSVGSGLAGLVVLADHLASNRVFPFLSCSSEVGGDARSPECAVCLCGLADGDRVRRLSCHHVFHGDCLDGWLLQLNLSCPLCRSQLASPEVRVAADRRIGADLVAWLSHY